MSNSQLACGWLVGWLGFLFLFCFWVLSYCPSNRFDILLLPSPTILKVDVFGHQTRVLIDDSWRVCDIVQEIGHKLDIGNDYEYSLKVWPAIVVVAVVVVVVGVVAVVVVVVTVVVVVVGVVAMGGRGGDALAAVTMVMWRSRLP